MKVTETLTLAADVLIIPVGRLPQRMRDEIGGDGDFAITRTHGRMPSVLVRRDAATLLGEFREPSTIVEAVLRYSRREGVDAETVLDDSYPALRRFIAAGCLANVDSDRARPRRTVLSVGERVAGGTVVRTLRALEDTELYQVTLDGGALVVVKLTRADSSMIDNGAHGREAHVLSVLDGHLSPRLLGTGEHDGHPWLSMEWCDGVSISTAAAGARRLRGAEVTVHDLCCRLTRSYEMLHGRGIVHGDVHPGNVLVAPSGDIRLLDFGLAGLIPGITAPPRGGVALYFDPQYAAAQRDGTALPPASFASDQYSVGALVYLLVTGSHYLDPSLDRAELLRQIIEDEPLPFVRRGRRPWPEVERALQRALQKDSGARFESMSMFAAAVDAARPSSSELPRTSSVPDALALALDEVITRARPGGAWFEGDLPAPSCSVAYGAAGLAVALHAVAALRSDPSLLSLADEWAVRAARQSLAPDAFDSAELQLNEQRTGAISPYHRRSGVHAAQALVSMAIGDTLAAQQAIHSFIDASQGACAKLDLALGRAGTVHVSAVLIESRDNAVPVGADRLIEFGRRSADDLWADLDIMPPIADGGPILHLGVAHGWAGLLLARLRWSEASGDPIPADLPTRLEQLAELARPHGSGLTWRWRHDPTGAHPAPEVPGWCNGTAGFVHLWTTAHRMLQDQRWLELAERAAWSTHAAHQRVGQLCCGLAGQTYALLDMYQHNGEQRWLSAARDLAARAGATVGHTGMDSPLAASLHKGHLGTATLAAAVEQPEVATMPLFGMIR